MKNPVGLFSVQVKKVNSAGITEVPDSLAVEGPLEIQLDHETLSITMRTPGQDSELALGYLFTEGVIQRGEDVLEVLQSESNKIQVVLKKEAQQKILKNSSPSKRYSYTSSSCGACGKTSLEDLKATSLFEIETKKIGRRQEMTFEKEFFFKLPSLLKIQQDGFAKTGGAHASALFSQNGKLIVLKEDVGRHNALDKVIGFSFMNGILPLNRYVLVLSGRVSFELMQKAYMAGVRVVAAIGAPSSYAVELAREHNMTLIGFLRDDRYNIYHGSWRVRDVEKDFGE